MLYGVFSIMTFNKTPIPPPTSRKLVDENENVYKTHIPVNTRRATLLKHFCMDHTLT